jgi:hypothetical protein
LCQGYNSMSNVMTSGVPSFLANILFPRMWKQIPNSMNIWESMRQSEKKKCGFWHKQDQLPIPTLLFTWHVSLLVSSAVRKWL